MSSTPFALLNGNSVIQCFPAHGGKHLRVLYLE